MNLRDVEPVESGPRKLPAIGKLHPAKIILAEAATSSAGNAMVKIQAQLTEEEAEGYILYDNFLTDGSSKGAGFTIPKLQGLGIDTNEEISDEELAERLLNLEFFVEVKHEPIKDQDARTGKYSIPRYEQDPVTGKNVLAKRAVAKRYSLSANGNQPQTASASQPAQPPAPAWPQPPAPPAAPSVQSGPPNATPPWMQPQAGAPSAPPPPPAPARTTQRAPKSK